jgi:hypothetical protein
MSVISFAFIYIVAAFMSACLFDFFWRAIGNPHQTETGEAGAYQGYIFSFYGNFVCRKYNEVELNRAVKASQKAQSLVFSKAEIQRIKDAQNIDIDSVAIMRLREQQAEVIYKNDTRLNWYKPLGVCSFCTSYWFYTAAFVVFILATKSILPLSLGIYLILGLHFGPLAIKINEWLTKD